MKRIYQCEKCNDIFERESDCIGHEGWCEQYQVGDRVEILYGRDPSNECWITGTVLKINMTDWTKEKLVLVKPDGPINEILVALGGYVSKIRKING